jgi:hypothetical protein
MNVEYTVIYPKVDCENPGNDPYIANYGKEKSFNHCVFGVRDGANHTEVLERIFAGMNGGSGQEFAWFQGAGARSLSVGDVVILPHCGHFIVDGCGWMDVSLDEVKSWLAFPRKHGCCSHELHDWAKTGIK